MVSTPDNDSVLSGTVWTAGVLLVLLGTRGGLYLLLRRDRKLESQPTIPQKRGDEPHHRPAKGLTRPSFAHIMRTPFALIKDERTSQSQIRRPTRCARRPALHSACWQSPNGSISDQLFFF